MVEMNKKYFFRLFAMIFVFILVVNFSFAFFVDDEENSLKKLNSVKLTESLTKGLGEYNIISISGNSQQVTSTLYSNNLPESNGYIIEFDSPSVVKSQLKSGNVKSVLLNEHNTIKNAIKSKLSTNSNGLKKTGSTYQLNVLGEYTVVFNGVALNITSQEAESIKSVTGVKKVYPNTKVKAFLMDSVPLINADDVWKLDAQGNNCAQSGKPCLTGRGVKIAIIDTGVDYTHSDFGSCSQSQFLSGSCNKVIGGYDFVNNDNDPMDDHGHGTHVAATAAGKGVLKGVAPDASIVAYKVLDSYGVGYWDKIILAIERVADPNQDGNTADHLDVLSMSLGGSGNPDDAISLAVDNAVDAGVVAVIAAGNSGPGENTIGSPGTSRKAITVGATDKFDQIAWFSSRGPVIWTDENGNTKYLMKPDVVAPGVDICAAEFDSAWSDRKCLDNKHISISGTSMATPHVAGAVALIKQKHPDWTPEEIKMDLISTTQDLKYENYIQGRGLIDTLNAINSRKLLVADVYVMQRENKILDILGTAKGDGFQNYKIYYSYDNLNWKLICTGKDIVDNGILCTNINTRNFIDGDYKLKLVVEGNNGSPLSMISFGSFKIDYFHINNPMNNDIYRIGDKIRILGLIDTDYSSYEISWSKVDSENFLNDGIKLIKEEDLLAIWDTSELTDGFYILSLKVNYLNGQQVVKKKFNIYLDSTLKKGWPQKINWSVDDFNGVFAPGYGEINAYDLDNDGFKELIMAINKDDYFKVVAFNEDGTIKWERSLTDYGRLSYSHPFVDIGDIDGDSYPELIVSFEHFKDYVDFTVGELYVLDYRGNILWRKDLGKFIEPKSLIVDTNFDGYKEIILQGANYYLSNENGDKSCLTKRLIFNYLGKSLFETCFEFDRFGGSIEPHLAVGNFDEDSDFEIVSMGNRNFNEEENILVTINNLDGSFVKGWPIILRDIGSFPSSPIIGDLDNDGYQDILFGVFSIHDYSNPLYGGVYAINKYGQALVGWPVAKGNSFWSTPALGDVDGDNFLEVSADSFSLTYLFNHDGSLFNNKWPQTHYWAAFYSSIIGDVDGGDLDIIATVGNGFYPSIYYHDGVYAWNSEGNLINSFPKILESDVQAPAVVTDIDNDGKLELIAYSNSDYDFVNGVFKQRNSIYVWELNSIDNKLNTPWPMFQHDPQHTGCYDCVVENSIIRNYGDKDENVRIIMKLQKKKSNGWDDVQIVTNGIYKIPSNNYLSLTNLWNVRAPKVSKSGDYRVYTAILKPDKSIAIDKSGKKLETNYEFKVK